MKTETEIETAADARAVKKRVYALPEVLNEIAKAAPLWECLSFGSEDELSEEVQQQLRNRGFTVTREEVVRIQW